MRTAFKEWAVICQALGRGRQSLILRKGGIAETGGEFGVEQRRFWLFPTYLHQKESSLRPEAHELLRQVESEKPTSGVIRIEHFVEVAGIYHLHDMVGALRLFDLHLWTNETVHARFTYRQPGLHVLAVRVFRAASVIELPDNEYYAGCKSWLELAEDLPTEGATPVLHDEAFRQVMQSLESRLNPTAAV